MRLGAAEIVVPTDFNDDLSLPQSSWLPKSASVSKHDTWRWQEDRAERALLRHFEAESLDGFGLTGKPFAIRAAGGLLQYLEDTQLTGLEQITDLRTYSTSGFMTLDAQTRRNLELEESVRGDSSLSLIAVLDQTKTPMGGRLLRKRIGQPLLDVDELNERLDVVTWFVEHTPQRAGVREALRKIGDIERLQRQIRRALGIVVAAGIRNQMLVRERLQFPAGVATAATMRQIHGDGPEAARGLRLLGGGGAVAAAQVVLDNLRVRSWASWPRSSRCSTSTSRRRTSPSCPGARCWRR